LLFHLWWESANDSWTANKEGRGPAWSNSLFEDNAEFGLGFRVSLDKQREFAAELLQRLSSQVGEQLAHRILQNQSRDEADVFDQRQAVAALKQKLLEIVNGNRVEPPLSASRPLTPSLSPSEGERAAGRPGEGWFMGRGQGSPREVAARLLTVADAMVKKSVWIIGGDGWAYDIGFGGLDHVLASGRNVKVLVLDTEVYSNTGGQTSKATPRGAVAKFSAGGKPTQKKDLGLIAMAYGNVYVASVAMGAKDEHTLKAFLEAEAYDGPALIIAYSHCIAHGINMTTAMQNQKAAAHSGQWLLYRYNPERAGRGENPLQLDSQTPRMKVQEYFSLENRFKMLTKSKPEQAKEFFDQAQHDAENRWHFYQYLAARPLTRPSGTLSPNGGEGRGEGAAPTTTPQPKEKL